MTSVRGVSGSVFDQCYLQAVAVVEFDLVHECAHQGNAASVRYCGRRQRATGRGVESSARILDHSLEPIFVDAYAKGGGLAASAVCHGVDAGLENRADDVAQYLSLEARRGCCFLGCLSAKGQIVFTATQDDSRLGDHWSVPGSSTTASSTAAKPVIWMVRRGCVWSLSRSFMRLSRASILFDAAHKCASTAVSM